VSARGLQIPVGRVPSRAVRCIDYLRNQALVALPEDGRALRR
jgi:hypothetical protein